MKKSLCYGLIGVLVSIATAGAAAAAAPGGQPALRSVESTPIISQVLYAHVAPNVFTGRKLELAVTGLSPSGERVEITRPLPSSYQRESRPYATVITDAADGYKDRLYRLVYTFRDKRYVAGYVAQSGDSDDDPYDWNFTWGELTNVPWEFDPKTQRFLLDPKPSTMPPVPVPFRQKEWKGICFAIPKALKQYTVEKAREEIEARGGRVATTDQEHVDVVLLRDSIDFVFKRNEKAESWMRQGAKVLKERSFRRVLRNEPVPAGESED